MNKFKKIEWLLLVGLVAWVSYLTTQKPKVWWNHQWAGICLVNGGYRSWTIRFCDGDAFVDGKMQPVVLTENGCRPGYFYWPKFEHMDARTLDKKLEE